MDLVQDVILSTTINDDQIRETSSISDNKFRKNGKYTDAAIRTRDGKLFNIHRNIMSANSSYFAALFDKDEDRQIYDLVSNISEEYFEKIIDYIYTGIFNVKLYHILIFHKYANEFQLYDLETFITNLLIKNINEVTCLEYWRHSVQLLKFELESECHKFIENNTELFIISSVCDLTSNELIKILSNKKLCCTHELLYLSISAWIKIDTDNRQKYFANFFQHIELTYLSKDFIKSHILTDKFVITNPDICIKINNYIEKIPKNHPDNEPLSNYSPVQHENHSKDELKIVLTTAEQNFISTEWEKFHLHSKMMKSLQPIDFSNMIKHCDLSLKVWNKLFTITELLQRNTQLINENISYQNEPKKNLIASSESAQTNDHILMLSKNWICKYNFDCIERIMKIEPRQRYSTCSFNQNSSVLISGGIDSNTCLFYSDSMKSIQKLPSMMEKRMMHSTIELNSKIYCLGGYWNSGSFEIYDIQTEKWLKTDSKMYKKEFDFGVINNGGSLYTFGGSTRNRGYSETVERYDSREGVWTNLIEDPKELFTAKSLCINDFVYCFGEMKSAIFDIRKNRWRIKSFSNPVNIELHWLYFDVLNFNKTIYVLGNHNYQKSLLYSFDYKDDSSWLELNVDFSVFEGYEYHLAKITSNN